MKQKKNEVFDYDKVCSTFYDKHTKNLYQRQLALLEKVSRLNENGYCMRDLEKIQAVIAAACMQVENGMEEFMNPLCDLIRLCEQPFVRLKSNEEIVLPNAVPALIRQLGVLLQSKEPQVQAASAEALYRISTGDCLVRESDKRFGSGGDAKLNVDLRITPKDYSRRMIQQEGIVEIALHVVQDLVIFEYSENGQDGNKIEHIERMELLLFPVMELLRDMSHWPANAVLYVENGALDSIVRILNTVHDLNDDLLPLCIEILWNVLENLFHESTTNKVEYAKDVDFHSIIASFGNLIALFFQDGYRRQHKSIRNECLIILTLLLRKQYNTKESHCMEGTDILNMIIKFSIGGEVGGSMLSDALNRNVNELCSEDFELKLLLWSLVTDISRKEKSVCNTIVDSPYMQVLLMYISSEDTSSKCIHQWSSSQLKILRLAAFSSLLSIAMKSPKAFYDLNGHAIVLHCVKSCDDEEMCKRATLLLYKTSTIIEIRNELGKMGCVSVMTDIFHDLSRDIEVRKNAVSVLSRICRNHAKNQNKFRNAQGVGILYEQLNYNVEDDLKSRNIIVCIIDAVWSCVVGNVQSEKAFLFLEGMDSILMLLESTPLYMRNQILGILSDLCCNSKAVIAFHGWKSPLSFRTGTQLLLSFWVEEEKRLNVQRPESGIIHSMHYPLGVHHHQPLHADEDHANDADSPAFSRLMDALQAAQELEPNKSLFDVVAPFDRRAKVYAVLAKVGFRGNCTSLSNAEQITLVLAQEYPTLHEGQLWQTLKTELDTENLRPIQADRLTIEQHLEKAFNIGMTTKCTQSRLYDLEKSALKSKESQFFKSILNQKDQELQVQLLMKKNKQPKGTMKSRLEAKAKKEEMLKQSLQLNQTNAKNQLQES